uniref:MADS-box domain-containing protein n=1 Tax=Tetraodon nigroviridis TaxID=99883 RepID=H3BZQ6_TETNG
MGRKKIQITRIIDERNRQVTFMKRKFGLMKKAYELSVLCDCEIALIIFNGSNKLFQYASTDMDKVLLKYTEYNEPHESRTNSDILEALNKKEPRGGHSPEADSSYVLTPTTEEKYKRINEEFDHMVKSHKMVALCLLPQQSFMHAAPGGGPYGSLVGAAGPSSQALAAAALANSGSLASAHTHLHRSLASPQRPPSTAHAGVCLSFSSPTCDPDPEGSPQGFPSVGSPQKVPLRGFPSVGSPQKVPLRGFPSEGSTGTVMVSPGWKSDLRMVVPPSKGPMQTLSNQRASSSPSSQPLSTPVVSITTPSVSHHQSLVYSSITAAYNNDYLLPSGELSGFGSPPGHPGGSVPAWQQQLGSVGLGQSQHGGRGGSGSTAPLWVHSSSYANAKGAQKAPVRSANATNVHQRLQTQHPQQQDQLLLDVQPPQIERQPLSPHSRGRSPPDSLSSSCSSQEGGSDREEQPWHDFLPLPTENPTVKRMRRDSWVT